MKTKLWAIFLVAFCTFLTASAQLFYKLGVGKFGDTLLSMLNWQILLGLCLYGIAAVLFVVALKFGELSVLYPVIALSFVWVNLLSNWFLGEGVGFLKWLGIVLIIMGVSFVGFGSEEVKPVVN